MDPVRENVRGASSPRAFPNFNEPNVNHLARVLITAVVAFLFGYFLAGDFAAVLKSLQ